MNENKNKQQPNQGSDKNQGNTKNQGGAQGSSKQGDMQGHQDSSKMPHNRANIADTKREQPLGSDIENPDRENDPEKKVNIDDDPEQTKKKVPNMGK